MSGEFYLPPGGQIGTRVLRDVEFLGIGRVEKRDPPEGPILGVDYKASVEDNPLINYLESHWHGLPDFGGS